MCKNKVLLVGTIGQNGVYLNIRRITAGQHLLLNQCQSQY